MEELLDPFYSHEQFFRLGTYHIPTGVDFECESLVALSSEPTNETQVHPSGHSPEGF